MRRLMLLRHAKTEADAPSGKDHDRRLDDRGRSDAADVGAWMARHHHVPDLVLVSTAVRAQQTWHIVTDTTGLMVGAAIHPADVQDRDAALLVIEAIHDLFPWLRHLFADSAYSGDKLLQALAKFGRWSIEIVKRMADTVGFEVLPRRWVVERTLAWLNRNRRLAKDFEATIESAKAWVYIASIQLIVRRMACC